MVDLRQLNHSNHSEEVITKQWVNDQIKAGKNIEFCTERNANS